MNSSANILNCSSSIGPEITTSVTLSPALGQTENSSQPNEEYWQIDFLNAWETVNGNHQYGLFINLSHEWKTYWKNPGDSGFTPEFQISRSENLAKIELIWPTPDIFLENDSQIYGFKKKLVLPTSLNSFRRIFSQIFLQ